MLLVLGVAFIGLVQIFEQSWARWLAIAGLLVIVTAAIVVRMRGRLSHRILTR